ncbi:MAG: ATP-binding protein [Verrucomicrobiota bacterium]|jgi:signal transduction histidine kinase
MHSIRWKMILSTILVVLIPVCLLNRYAIKSFDTFTSDLWEAQMIDHAIMTGQAWNSTMSEAEKRAYVQRADEEAGMRFRILDPEGQLLLDTQPDEVDGPPLVERFEIKNALKGGYAARNRLTPDRKYMYYFCAQPIKQDGKVLSVVYVSRHTSPIILAIKSMFTRQRTATITALLLAACVSALVAMTLTYRLRRLTHAATAFAEGREPEFRGTGGKDEIGELSEAFQDMAKEIEQRHAYNQEFFKNVVHELKTPITAIRGALEVLESGAAEEPENRERFMRNIKHQNDRLSRLLGEMKTLTRIEAESPRTPREVVDYGELLREIIGFLEPAFDTPHAAIQLDLPDQALRARVSPERIEQVMANLLENALRYTAVEGKVRITIRQEAGEIVTRIADNGCGISASNREKVFQRFFTTEPRGEQKAYGSGLGLAIAKSIIEAHTGCISVESVPGEGATFTFSLPEIPPEKD